MRTLCKAVLLTALLSPMWISTPAKADYKPNFNTGRIPKDMSTANANGLKPVLDCYVAGYTLDGWTVDRVGLKGYCAISPTHTRSGEPCDNRLTLPELEIEPGMWLRWNALSVAADFPESYSVSAVIDGDETVTLLNVDEEAGDWTTHLIPLSEYAGRRMRLEFRCNSVNRYMLALNGIFVGTPSEPEFVSVDSTARFAGYLDTGKAIVKVTSTNVGAPADIPVVECVAGEGHLYGSYRFEEKWNTGETRTFEFEIPLTEEGGKRFYTVDALQAPGYDRVTLSKGPVYTSLYTRTLLLDKGTGMWCLNCPKGILEVEGMEKEFGANMAAVDTHSLPEQDPLANPGYWDGLGFYAAPYFMLNRMKSTATGSTSDFRESYYERPTVFRIAVKDIHIDGNSEATVKVTAAAAKDIDNEADRYRIGYVLTADFFEPDNHRFHQQNDINNPTGGRFYFLPKKIPADLIKFHNVSLTSENAFSGFANSLPSNLEKGKEYEFSWKVQRPELLDDLRDARVVAYIIDTEEADVENAAAALFNTPSGIESVTASGSRAYLRPLGGGMLEVEIPGGGQYLINLYDFSGRLCRSMTGVCSGTDIVKADVAPGMYVACLVTPTQSIANKMTIK